MKRIALVMAFLLLAISSFAQQSRFRKPTQKEIHLQKAENKSAGGWILIGLGSALVLGSIIATVAHGPSGKDQPNVEVPVTIGALALAGGLTLKIASVYHKNKALEASAYFNFQPLPGLNQTATNQKFYPAFVVNVKAL